MGDVQTLTASYIKVRLIYRFLWYIYSLKLWPHYCTPYLSYTDNIVSYTHIYVCPAGYWMFTPACCQDGEAQRPSSTPSCMGTLWQESPSCRSGLTGIQRKTFQCLIYFVNINVLKVSSNPRFDVGPILNQEVHQVHEKCTADELEAILATKGAHLVSWWNVSGRKWLTGCLSQSW